MSRITPTDLQPLLNEFTGAGGVLSCYADLDVAEGFRPNWEQPFKAKADGLWKVIGEDSRARRELEVNLFAIRCGLDAARRDEARWAAVFSATSRGFFQVFNLDVPVSSDLVLDSSPYLVPLLAAAHRRREYLAVHTDTHHAQVFAATPGSVELLTELDEEVPRHQHSSGERFGYEQATIARHREDRILHYRKHLTRELAMFWDSGAYSGLILLGEHEVLEHVRHGLPTRLASRVLCEIPEAWYEGLPQIEEKVRSIAVELFDKQESEVAPGFWDLLKEGKAVTGVRPVLDVLQSGHLGMGGHGYLVFGPDPRETVGRCSVCRTLAPEPGGKCRRCQASCVPGNLWEEMLLAALKHGITTRFVSDRQKLEPYGGVVAVLPKPEQVRKP